MPAVRVLLRCAVAHAALGHFAAPFRLTGMPDARSASAAPPGVACRARSWTNHR